VGHAEPRGGVGRMSRAITLHAYVAALAWGTWACGNVSEPVLERIAARVPPAYTHRVEVFLVTTVAGCAIGSPCAEADPERCFYVRSESGTRYFEPEGLELAPVGDARVESAPQSACFQLDLSSEEQADAVERFRELRAGVFQLSEGNVDLDVRVHAVAPETGDFKSWGSGGVFLQPASLSGVGLPLMNRDSDFTFAVTGEGSSSGALPKIDACGGTNWQMRGGLGGAAYTWLSTSCLSPSTMQWHLLYQAAFAMRDVVGLATPEVDGYPACGQGVADPRQWFPRPSDCASDPDAASCGDASCDADAFAAHIFVAHWPAGAGLIGNHCRNGQTDYDESASDMGGVCDALGR
jgi:hypothetical protein